MLLSHEVLPALALEIDLSEPKSQNRILRESNGGELHLFQL